MKNYIVKIKEGLIFSITAGVILILMGTIYASLSSVEPGDTLTAEMWNNLIPAGATIAFNSSACPNGWSVANDLKDKFIIGAGNSYSVGATGGSATTSGTVGNTILTTNQIPSHNHSSAMPSSATTIYAFSSAQIYSARIGIYYHYYAGTNHENPQYQVTSYNISSATTSTTGNAGGGQAHNHTFTGGNNLPPFVAYIYCTKN